MPDDTQIASDGGNPPATVPASTTLADAKAAAVAALDLFTATHVLNSPFSRDLLSLSRITMAIGEIKAALSNVKE